MKVFVKTALASLLMFLNGSYLAHAQVSIEDQIREHLNTLPDKPEQLVLSTGSLVSIPDSAKSNLRFEFQKRMALSGHGVLYDVEGREVTLDWNEVFRLQEEMLRAVRGEKPQAVEGRDLQFQQGELNEIIKSVEGFMHDGIKPIDQFAAMNLLTRAEAAKLEDKRRSEYDWRSNYLMNAVLRIDLLAIFDLRIVRLSDLYVDWLYEWMRTDYQNECSAAGVPIPPDFALSGTDWEFQGQLTTKLIAAASDANVWTWHESGERGACVALPRGTGGAGSLAGIICQSAETGNACFWDNLPKGGGSRIPWGTEPLIIKELQDGSELAENCTNCHQGNNVFLLAPDDPTWCRLLRGQTSPACLPIDGADIANFTLAVEATVNPVNVPNTSIFHSRYTPISGTPPRSGWENTETLGCGGVCHLGGGAVTPPPMPPGCGVYCY